MEQRPRQPWGASKVQTGGQQPYLSAVAVARNDDHGGNLLGRVQIFVSAFLGQVRRHGIPSELILVEWNPPPDRPRLAEVLRWPDDFGPCTVRIIEAPPAIHSRYNHGQALPLYQMIAKNAGIRRARGEYVLATNIDVLFSDALYEFLRSRALDPWTMYRLDRLDVASDVPVYAPLDEQLAFCETHLLRVNAREGTFPVLADGSRTLSQQDISSKDSGILLGRGWYAPEEYLGRPFRWFGHEAELIILANAQRRALELDVEPGPGMGGELCRLQVLDEGGTLLAETAIQHRTRVHIVPPADDGGPVRLWLRAPGGGAWVADDPRVLNVRVFRCDWASNCAPPEAGGGAVHLYKVSTNLARRCLALPAGAVRLLAKGVSFLLQLRKSTVPLRVGIPLSRRALDRLQIRVEGGGVSFSVHPDMLRLRRWGSQPNQAAALSRTVYRGARALKEPIHTNACGDFTLMARERWLDLRGYAEFDMYSLHVDSLLCWAAWAMGLREEVLEDPMRMYHVEHDPGSGWTPEGKERLSERLHAKGVPCLDYGQVVAWLDQMRRFERPLIFNTADWGLAGDNLSETVLGAR